MARAHRLSGYDSDDEEDEFEELQEKKANNDLVRQLYSITLHLIDSHHFCFDICIIYLLFLFQNWFDRAKVGVEDLVKRVGFFGILACASVSL